MKILDTQHWWIRLPNKPKLIAARVVSHTDLTVELEQLNTLEAFGLLGLTGGSTDRYITKELIFVEQIPR